jgi:glycosyltransferase involved in cell wall biosynthesis
MNYSSLTVGSQNFLKKNPNRLYEGGLRLKNIFKKSSKDKPLITIITVVLNNEKFIEETINSIINQKYTNVEYIIIDGGSTDNTLNIIKKYQDNIDYIISENDHGLYDAMNKGLILSRGDLIGIVNSDDILTTNAMDYLIQYYSKYPALDLFFGTVRKHWGLLHGFKPYKIKYSWFFYTSHSTGFYITRKAAIKNGKYSLNYNTSSDFDYFYRAIVHNKFKGIASKKNELFGIFRPGGISNKVDFWELFFEKIQIRIDNKQNKYLIFLTLILKLIKSLKKIPSLDKNVLINFLKKNYWSEYNK